MKTPEFNQRDWLPDQMKGWAVFWMILVHSVELFLTRSQWDHPIAQLSFFMGAVPAAPVFMLLMGYYAGRRGIPAGMLILRGLKILLWGLLLNIGLNASLMIRWLSDSVDVNLLEYLFGVDILIFAGLALILSGIIQLARTPWYIWLFLGFSIPLLNTLNLFNGQVFQNPPGVIHPPAQSYLLALVGGSFSWSYFPLVPWLGYVFAGIGLRRLFEMNPSLIIRSCNRFYAAIPAAVITIAGLIPAWKITQDLGWYYHHGVWFFIWALSFILILSLVLLSVRPWLEGFAGKWIRFYGVRVTHVFVIQWLIIGNLGTWLYQSLTVFQTLFIFAGVLLLTTILTYLYYKKQTS